MIAMIEKGTQVILNVPDNPRLHGAPAIVKEATEWGAYVATNAAATGEFRALTEEMLVESEMIQANGVHSEKMQEEMLIPTQYTGDICVHCQSARMRRVGTCLVCSNCGDSTSC